ncbi:bifunctional diguanylate cyclase/phosphodiesterase [Paraglaciecola psychrophila]|uniref:bifunctional diguanylate cyclase/phosphodiesterase n=1 Tax=Paraglaciecola psychrophila TaxID=326544 RepID=UPI00029142EE|nr:EAL domain-containing protein [Paraglaciecola psychrophila]GAC39630.1 intracellular signaling protein [Paraglaciecola psychrophila 170]
MISKNNANQLSLEELRELVPQLQRITKKYKHSESIQNSLFDISELASSINELSSLYPAIHDIIGDLMPAQNFFVAFYEEEKKIIDFVYFVDEFDEQVVSQVSADDLKNSLTGYILRTGQHLFLTQETYQQQLADISVKDLGAAPVDWIGIPLKRGSQVIGAMVVQSYDESIRYNREDLEILLFVSQHIVNSVDRVKSRELTEKTIRQRTKQLRQMNEELQEEISERQKIESLQQALFEISELSASVEGDMHDFYAAIHDTLSRLIGAPNCYVAMISNDKKTLNFPYYKDEVHSKIEPRPMGLGLTEYVIRHGSAELIDGSKVQQLIESNELTVIMAESKYQEMDSWIGSPLIIDGEICGVIAVQSYSKEKQYNFKDLEFLRFVSHHIAVALSRKQSSDAIKAYNQKLAEEVKERTEELNSTNLFLQKQIEERLQAQQQLEHDAQHDSLTGLANRVLFNSRLELALASKQRYVESNFAVIFIDLDRFKQINDSLGHMAGDLFLKEVSVRISSCIRGHDLLARLGGDEFVVLFDNYESPNDVEEISARIISSIAKPFNIENKDMYSGASIGIAYIESGYQTADEVLRDADAAMYQAKSLGRGRYIVFDKTMRDKLLEELEIESEFRKILQAEAFESYSQPIINLATQEQIYQECYVRWEHSSIGKIKRDQYWQIAEQCGLTVEMDKFMLTKACEILKGWQLNEADADKQIAINLSIHHLTQTSLAKQLIEQVKNARVDPKKLVIEFDENALNRRSQFFLPAIKILKRAGITLVLDNFGSGLASLSYLYSYPFDYVKIDHYFVKTLPRSERNLKLIQSVLSISGHLKFKLIASGINTQEQYQALLDAGCEFGQGKFLKAAAKIEVN